ncbi:MAG: GNAT family N-acetyltransferase [Ruminococcus sp.]|nr:GNAT family N-acetyltransferase [Ruminococcus sp.]
MIRHLQAYDLDEVSAIWLDTNIKAHSFIPTVYWKKNFSAVKEMLLKAEVYVYEKESNDILQGFIGLNDDYIEGIFVCSEFQSAGVGKALLDFVKSDKDKLRLHVYAKNERAIKFYIREGFTVQNELIDEATGENEFAMLWESKNKKDE